MDALHKIPTAHNAAVALPKLDDRQPERDKEVVVHVASGRQRRQRTEMVLVVRVGPVTGHALLGHVFHGSRAYLDLHGLALEVERGVETLEVVWLLGNEM